MSKFAFALQLPQIRRRAVALCRLGVPGVDAFHTLAEDHAQDALQGMLQRFHDEHERAYGFAALDEPVEFVTLRLTAVGNITKPKLLELPLRSSDTNAA